MLSIMLTTCHTWRCLFSLGNRISHLPLLQSSNIYCLSAKATRHSLDDVFSQNRVLQFLVSLPGFISAFSLCDRDSLRQAVWIRKRGKIMQLQSPLSRHSPQGPPINGQMVKLLKMLEARDGKKLASGVLSVKPNRMHIPELCSLKSSLNPDNSFGHFLKILLLTSQELSSSTLHMNSFQ